jgi:hypothetical protein
MVGQVHYQGCLKQQFLSPHCNYREFVNQKGGLPGRISIYENRWCFVVVRCSGIHHLGGIRKDLAINT